MVRRGLVRSRSEARRLIEEGRVTVGGRSGSKPAAQVDENSPIDVHGAKRFVGRAGEKLDAALDHFGIDPSGRRALDVGASVGGFTDCLLRRGAVSVVAVDVGHGQMSPELARNPAVHSIEGLDFQQADPEMLGGPFDLVVIDLSFISVCAVAGALAAATSPAGDVIILVKPQFEVGRDRIGRGVVSNPILQEEAVTTVKNCVAAAGLDSVDVMASPITGSHGNREYLLWARRADGK